MLRSLELYNDDVPRSAPMNMALDEVFWRTANTARLRFYRWDHPAISFGYFGRYADVADYEDEWEIVRRCTGGGIVFHGTDLTYALIIPAGVDRPAPSTTLVYNLVHKALQTALSKSGINARLVEDVAHASSGAPGRGVVSNSCFGNPVTSDVMIGSQKVAGAAQRRSRAGLLQQGSIQNLRLPCDFQRRFAGELAGTLIDQNIDPSMIEQATELAAAKYASKPWLQRI